jgi:glycosyltransferase involved in cell wall biosynthesis
MLNSTEKLPVSVFIVTLNEEKYLKRVLSSVSNFDEVIVVDSGSNDRTVEIARDFGAKITHQGWLGYAKQKQFAMSLCKNDWVLNLDGDEVLNASIVCKFKQIVENDEADSVRFWRNDIFINKRLSSLSKRPNNLRLYKKSLSQFDENVLVHESAKVNGREMFINEEFDHYGYETIAGLTQKNNQYSCLKASMKYQRLKKASTMKLLLVFPITFLKQLILQRMLFSGRRGFIKSVIVAYYAFLKEAKLFELSERSK